MPINPEIALQGRPVQFDTTGVVNLMNQGRQMQMQQQALQMQHESHAQQMQAGALDLQAKTLEMQDQQNMRTMLPQLLKDNNGDWEKAAAALAPHVSPKTAFGLQTMFLGNAEKKAQISKATADAAQANATVAAKERDFLGNMALGIQQSGYNPEVFNIALQHAAELNPSYKDHIAQIQQAVQQNPDAMQQLVDSLVSGSEVATKEGREQHSAAISDEKNRQESAAAKRNLAVQELTGISDAQGNITDPAAFTKWRNKYPDIAPGSGTPQAISQFLRSGVPVKDQPQWDIDSNKAKMGLMGNSEYDQYLAQYARSLGKAPNQLTPQEGLESFSKFAEAKQDPVMRSLAIAQKNLAQTLQKTQIEGAPTKEDAAMLADDIINHRLAPDQLSQIRGRGNGQLGIMIERELKRVDPKFNWEQASSEYQLAKSPSFQQNVRYMDSVQESIPLVIDRAQKLANGGVRGINALVNAGKNQFNDIDLKKFDTDRLLVADEIAKILQGGGTGGATSDAKMRQAGEILKQSDNPASIAAALGDVKELIGFRRKALTRGTYLENATPQAGGAGGHVIEVGGKQYSYNGTGATDDLKNYTEVKK